MMVFSLVVSILPTFAIAETNSNDSGVINPVASEIEKGPLSEGEVESERTPNTKTFYLGEGKFERKIFATPIHQKDEKSGKWKEISPNLVDKSTLEVTTEETFLTPSFLKKMDTGKYVTSRYNHFIFIPIHLLFPPFYLMSVFRRNVPKKVLFLIIKMDKSFRVLYQNNKLAPIGRAWKYL